MLLFIGSQPKGSVSGPVVQLVRTLACHARGRRFDPVPDRFSELSLSERVQFYAGIAQSAERILGKDEVTSSNLVISSTKHSRDRVLFCCVKTAEMLMFTGFLGIAECKSKEQANEILDSESV